VSNSPEKHDVERQAIREAADRLLARSGPKPSIESLRREAGLTGRWLLTHRHVDLKDEFLNAVEQQWGVEASAVVATEKKMQDLQKKYDRLRDRNAELETLVDAYAAVIEELTHQRDSLINAAGSQEVTPFRQRTP
jgi:uncharacterized protein YlxW (UPF0749 family)